MKECRLAAYSSFHTCTAALNFEELDSENANDSDISRSLTCRVLSGEVDQVLLGGKISPPESLPEEHTCQHLGFNICEVFLCNSFLN